MTYATTRHNSDEGEHSQHLRERLIDNQGQLPLRDRAGRSRCFASLRLVLQLKSADLSISGHPRRPVVFSVTVWRPPILAHLVADVLDATEDRKHLAARPTVLGAELAGEALAVAEAPVDDDPSHARSVDGPFSASGPWARQRFGRARRIRTGVDSVSVYRSEVSAPISSVQAVASPNGTRLSAAQMTALCHFTRSLIFTPIDWATASTVEMRGSDVR